MAGLADIFNNPEKLQRVSQFLLHFGQGLSTANSQGLSPFASLSYGFGSGGQGLQDFQQQQELQKDREQRREALQTEIDAAQKRDLANSRLSSFISGNNLVANGQAPDMSDPTVRRQAASLLADAGDAKAALDMVQPPDFKDKYFALGNTLIDKQTLQPVADARMLPEDVLDQQMRLRLAGKTSNNVYVNTAADSFADKFGEENAKQFFERRVGAKDALASLQSNADAIRLLNNGLISGTGANFITEFGKALQQGGVNFAEDAVANTEAFVATRAKEVGRIIKLFGAGTGLSDADREFATKAAAGDITMNEESIRRILEINDKAARNVIEDYNKDAEKVGPGMSPYPLIIDAPPPVDFSKKQDASQYLDMSDSQILSVDVTKLKGSALQALLDEYRRRGLIKGGP